MDELLKHFPDLNTLQIGQFEQLEALYGEWNTQINVISRKDMEQFYERHLLHSLGISKVIQFKDGSTVLDVGTGGGFPGIPLAILFPNTQFNLIDSIGKKIKVVKAGGGVVTNSKDEILFIFRRNKICYFKKCRF